MWISNPPLWITNSSGTPPARNGCASGASAPQISSSRLMLKRKWANLSAYRRCPFPRSEIPRTGALGGWRSDDSMTEQSQVIMSGCSWLRPGHRLQALRLASRPSPLDFLNAGLRPRISDTSRAHSPRGSDLRMVYSAILLRPFATNLNNRGVLYPQIRITVVIKRPPR